MTTPPPSGQPDDKFDPYESWAQARMNWMERKREKAVQEILRNRRGEYTVPTWVLGAFLGAIILAWIALIIFT
jgi:hypothetical protein